MTGEPDPFQHTRMSLGDHLRELRRRVFRGAIALLAAFLIAFYFYQPIFHVVARPMNTVLTEVDLEQREKFEKILAEERLVDPTVPRTKYFRSEDPTETALNSDFTIDTRMTMVGPGEGFGVVIRITLLAALVLGMPVLLWQMWQFIAAGLYPHERRAILKFFPITVGLFVGGVLFGYFVMCPFGFKFMVTVFPPEEVRYIAAIGPYLEWLQAVTLVLGCVFELPVFMYALVRIGIVERKSLARFRPYFVLIAFVVGGILTPPDPITQFLAAGPMILLYELGLIWTWFLPKPKDISVAPEANP